MARKDELLRALGPKGNTPTVAQLVDEILFIEGQLTDLKQLPFIKVHPSNPALQKATPAAGLYVKLNAQYNANLRSIASLCGVDNEGEDTPLRMWIKNRKEMIP